MQRNLRQLEDVAGGVAERLQREGVLLPGLAPEVGRFKALTDVAVGTHPNNPTVSLIPTTALTAEIARAAQGATVLVLRNNGGKSEFWPGIIRLSSRGEVSVTALPVAVPNPAFPEISDGVKTKLKELTALQHRDSATARLDERNLVDVGGHGGAALLQVRDNNTSLGSDTHNLAHSVSEATGGVGVKLAQQRLYQFRNKFGQIVSLPDPVDIPVAQLEGGFVSYSGKLDTDVSETIQMAPEMLAMASGVVAVASVTEQPPEKVQELALQHLQVA